MKMWSMESESMHEQVCVCACVYVGTYVHSHMYYYVRRKEDWR